MTHDHQTHTRTAAEQAEWERKYAFHVEHRRPMPKVTQDSYRFTPIEPLLGCTILAVQVNAAADICNFTYVLPADKDPAQLPRTMLLLHGQQCCEEVYLDNPDELDFSGIIGSPLLVAEEVTNSETVVVPTNVYAPRLEHEQSQTWTFYKFVTEKGSVTLRWFGQSSGFYSEVCEFYWVSSEDHTRFDRWAVDGYDGTPQLKEEWCTIKGYVSRDPTNPYLLSVQS